ncbi:hypothetical protein GFY24_35165 [Nocardia sp. SYP-A9097]|uniref:sigma 54 modulation/S30EA ribosomal C-terminal domain-containing protein n=1 Tax=Nocardia sp. SYP-A9097 TaxID=2663237 RepID=UPI00129BC70E|nr:sigma 54 modulation/S30EA ribosomal C-terminal domain-containing protein [Nocardia sp. SYP-A9097]MRH92604.1 hypothetical protein [Nocardia sp. SYP-A9097]
MDSVLYRTEDGAYRLAQVQPHPEMVLPGATAFTISAAAPELEMDGAVARLELTGWPFVFFRDHGRSHVLYHRYDGHYGLITPAG